MLILSLDLTHIKPRPRMLFVLDFNKRVTIKMVGGDRFCFALKSVIVSMLMSLASFLYGFY